MEGNRGGWSIKVVRIWREHGAHGEKHRQGAQIATPCPYTERDGGEWGKKAIRIVSGRGTPRPYTEHNGGKWREM